MNKDTLRRARELVEQYRARLWTSHNSVLDPPDILPGPDESVDIHWDYPGYEILINIPVDTTAEIGFYCDDKKGTSLKGKLDKRWFNVMLLLWLAHGVSGQ